MVIQFTPQPLKISQDQHDIQDKVKDNLRGILLIIDYMNDQLKLFGLKPPG